MRLLSIIQWHHFAYMIISLALLGYGVSGSFLSALRDHVSKHFVIVYAANAGLFGLSTIGCFTLAQRVPFNGLELIWNPWQLGWLVLIYLLLMLPFLFAANCIGLALIRFRHRLHRIYLWDLIGAGLGAAGIIALLFAFSPQQCLLVIALSGFLGAALVLTRGHLGAPHRVAPIVLLGAAVLAVLWPASWSALKLSEYKGLSTTLQISGTEVLAQRSGPLGMLTVVASPRIPLRHAPGLSLSNTQEPPAQLAVFTDGDNMSVITRFEGDLQPLSYLDNLSSALPYHLLYQPRVLILGAGGGADVLQALYHGAAHIDAVEMNPHMVKLVRDDFASFAGELYRHPRVSVHIAEARGFLAETQRRHDLIQVALLDSFAASGAGTHALNESYLYTVEALGEYYAHLNENGLLAITRWLKVPARDTLKLFATAIDTLAQAGIKQPGNRLALIRSWQTSTLLIKKGDFNSADLDKLRAFAEQRSFDVAHYPGIDASETNRFNMLQRPYLYEGATALLKASRDAFLQDYKFNLQPGTDDRPYFFHFFKWRILPELYSLRAQGGLLLLDSGYLILTATLLQALPVSIVLVFLPLLLMRTVGDRPRVRWRPAVYFMSLGLGFLFIEIAFIQRFILFVSHPLYALAVVLSGFLIFAGLGSGTSAWLRGRLEPWGWSPIKLAVAAIAATSLVYALLLPDLLHAGIALPMGLKVVIALLLIAPLAFFMGMPFPLGLSILAQRAPQFIPWAWGINGCASVLSAILATLLAIHFGFQLVIVLAVALYGCAALIWE